MTTTSQRACLTALIGAAGLLAGCGGGSENPAPVESTVPDEERTAVDDDTAAVDATPDCPVIDSRDWTARIEGDVLRVSGEIDLPTPGYAVSWKEGPADRRMPPAQHLLLELAAPEGMVAQVIDTVSVEYEGAATYPEYRSILVRCGDQVLAAIVDIEHSD